MLTASIPVIDIAPLFAAPSASRVSADQAIMRAAEQAGFFVARGLPADIRIDVAARSELLRIFALPDSEIRKLWRRKFDPAHPNVYRGWFPLQTGHLTSKEGIDLGPDVAHGPAVLRSGDPLCEATPLPAAEALPGWRESVTTYYLAMERASAALMRSIARSLKIPSGYFDDFFQNGLSTLRLIRYPVRGDLQEAEQRHADLWVTRHGARAYIMGTPHVDSGFLTLLAQDDVGGLQAHHLNGQWLDVPPIEGTLAVNFGKVLERWCNGRIKATEHRVVGSGRERMSIPFFYEARVDAKIEPLPLDDAESFEPFLYGDHLWSTTTKFVEFQGMEGLRRPRHAAHARALTLCPHRPPCAGCPRFGDHGIASAAHGALDALARAHGLPQVAVVSGATAGFRHRARLAIRGRLGSPKVGLFELDSHRVVHIPNCSVQHPLINRVAAIVRRALVDARVTCYSDKAHLGLARYLQVVVERSSQTAQVVIVANCATPEPLAACLGLIRERLGSDLHSLWFNANLERSNVILGPDFTNWCGPESVVERFGGAAVHYPPGAFGQSNLDIAQRIVGHVRDQIPQGASVAEFYAGVGAIGLSILESVREIRMNEVSPQALKGLELGLARLEPADRAKVSVVPGAAGAACSSAPGAQVVIADPPRKGLDPELTEHLSEHPPQRFLYISCGLDSFLADAARLILSGKLRLAALSAFNFLPFTEHVETVARFERA